MRSSFFEKSLSTPPGQACSSCHSPRVAFADLEVELPGSRGAILGRYGNRNDMTMSYATCIRPLHRGKDEGIWIGGLFWDGRAKSLAEQAQRPPLNSLGMANLHTWAIAKKLQVLSYAGLFTEV
ncbi:MAG: cytochrome-c peroxidase [Sedimenticolaceae bacterium]